MVGPCSQRGRYERIKKPRCASRAHRGMKPSRGRPYRSTGALREGKTTPAASLVRIRMMLTEILPNMKCASFLFVFVEPAEFIIECEIVSRLAPGFEAGSCRRDGLICDRCAEMGQIVDPSAGEVAPQAKDPFGDLLRHDHQVDPMDGQVEGDSAQQGHRYAQHPDDHPV